MSDIQKEIKLPMSIAQPLDIGQILREVTLIDEHLNQEDLRHNDENRNIKFSTKLREVVEFNNLDLSKPDRRQVLMDWLNYLKMHAPVANISFSSEASDEFIAKIVEWFRREVDPLCLIVIGLQPNIGVGSVLRTNNKIFDFSLRKRLASNRKLLSEEIKKLNTKDSNGQS